MNLFVDKHQKLLKNLLEAKVDFIIICGYSVIFHGYPRTTCDVDIWIKPDNENKTKVISSLKNTGIPTKWLSIIEKLDFTKHLVFSIWEEPEKVDFLTHINLVQFESAAKQKVIAEIDGLKIPFLHLNDLILSKINTGRSKDAADIEELQKIEKAKKKRK